MVTSLIMGNTVSSPSLSVLSTSFKETINCFSGQILTGKRGCFLRLGLDFIMPTEALLRCHSSRSVDGSLVHLRLRENLCSLFFLVWSCCLNTNLDTWLVLLIEQQPAASPAPSDILRVGTSILSMMRTSSRKLKAGSNEKKEEFLPDTAGMLNCFFAFRSADWTHVNLWGRAHKSTASQVLWTSS